MTALPADPARQCVALAAKDLKQEWRSGEALLVTAPFGAVALMFVPVAVGTDVPLLRQLGPGLYWVVVLLFGVLLTLRQSAADTPEQRDLLRLCGVHPAARLAGTSVANAVLLLAFQVVLAPVAVMLYDPPLAGWGWLLALPVPVAVGLATLGTVANALAQGLAGRTTLGPLLVAPLALPLLLGATQVTELAGLGLRPWPWLLLMITATGVVAVTLGLTARHLEESA